MKSFKLKNRDNIDLAGPNPNLKKFMIFHGPIQWGISLVIKSCVKSLACPCLAKLDRKYQFLLLMFHVSNFVKAGLTKILTRDSVTKDHPQLNSRSRYPAGVGGP